MSTSSSSVHEHVHELELCSQVRGGGGGGGGRQLPAAPIMIELSGFFWLTSIDQTIFSNIGRYQLLTSIVVTMCQYKQILTSTVSTSTNSYTPVGNLGGKKMLDTYISRSEFVGSPLLGFLLG